MDKTLFCHENFDKVIDIKSGAYHNVIWIENKINEYEYYLWGQNDCNQCLVFNKGAYITRPTKYDYKTHIGNNCKIIAIYPAFNATRIVTQDL